VYKILRDPVEQALSSRAAGRAARHRIRDKRLILAYHGIVPHGEPPAGERALFVSQRDFAAQLDLLVSFAEVVQLAHIDEKGDGRPRVAITFDDGYRGAVNEAVAELAQRGLPATIFVAPGRLDGHVFWWDSLSHGTTELPDTVRYHALHALEGSDERIRQWACDTGMRTTDAVPNYATTASLAELCAAVARPGITVGSHTWSHANLATLAEDDLASEMERSNEWLKTRFGGKAIPWIAYPYGLDSAQARRVAAKSYVGGLRIGGGWYHPRRVSSFERPRLNVSGKLSLAGFRARLLGAVRP
jgi:peptidoglycan/xylan/chitin deacetylase (PgdA/CDA1 family)